MFLLKAHTFVFSPSNSNIDAIVKSTENLTDEQVAQISNIMSRELDAEIENIHITIHK